MKRKNQFFFWLFGCSVVWFAFAGTPGVTAIFNVGHRYPSHNFAKSNFVFVNGFLARSNRSQNMGVGRPTRVRGRKRASKKKRVFCQFSTVPSKNPSCFRNGRLNFRCMHIYLLVFRVANICPWPLWFHIG